MIGNSEYELYTFSSLKQSGLKKQLWNLELFPCGFWLAL